jgi:integrase
LDKLRASDVEKWRDSLVTVKHGKAAANRILRTFKAAMNYAYKRRMASSDHVWRVAQQFPSAEGQRNTYLALEQCRELLAQGPGPLADFLTGLLYTAARPNELAAATVADFDQATQTLRQVTANPNIVACTMRHTAISDWLTAGLDVGTVAKMAGTSILMIDKNYHKFIRTAVADKLAGIAVI